MVSTVGKIILTIGFQFKFCIILLRYMLVMSNIMLEKTHVGNPELRKKLRKKSAITKDKKPTCLTF